MVMIWRLFLGLTPGGGAGLLQAAGYNGAATTVQLSRATGRAAANSITVLATDIDTKALSTARSGVYDCGSLKDLSDYSWMQFFYPLNGAADGTGGGQFNHSMGQAGARSGGGQNYTANSGWVKSKQWCVTNGVKSHITFKRGDLRAGDICEAPPPLEAKGASGKSLPLLPGDTNTFLGSSNAALGYGPDSLLHTDGRGSPRESHGTGHYDLILCRNCAFMYFDEETKVIVLPHLVEKLRPGGYLLLGWADKMPAGYENHVERISTASEELQLFQKPEKPSPADPTEPFKGRAEYVSPESDPV